jgi:hypothetical protein
MIAKPVSFIGSPIDPVGASMQEKSENALTPRCRSRSVKSASGPARKIRLYRGPMRIEDPAKFRIAVDADTGVKAYAIDFNTSFLAQTKQNLFGVHFPEASGFGYEFVEHHEFL